MLLYIYLGTAAFVWLDTLRFQLYVKKRLKKEGYVYTTNKDFSIGDIFFGTAFMIGLSIPLVNLIFPLSNIDKDRAYDEHKNYLLDAGAIELLDDEVKVEKAIKKSEVINKQEVENHSYYVPKFREETIDEIDKGFTYRKRLK